MRIVKKLIWIPVVLCILYVALLTYLHLCTSSPTSVVEDFWDAYNRNDVNEMVACMDPQTEQIFTGGTDLASSLLSGITGFDLDLAAMINILPLFADTSLDTQQRITIDTIQVVSYSPAFDPAIAEPLISMIPELVNIMAERAVVEFRIEGVNTSVQLEVVYYGQDGWRIPMTSDLIPVV